MTTKFEIKPPFPFEFSRDALKTWVESQGLTFSSWTRNNEHKPVIIEVLEDINPTKLSQLDSAARSQPAITEKVKIIDR